jgi:hypothetical protein
VDQAVLLPSTSVSDAVLGMLSDILAPSGFAQMVALFSRARQAELCAAMRLDVRKQGWEDSRDSCCVLFHAQVSSLVCVQCVGVCDVGIAHMRAPGHRHLSASLADGLAEPHMSPHG